MELNLEQIQEYIYDSHGLSIQFITRVQDFSKSQIEMVVQAMLSRPDGQKLVSEVERRRNEERFGLR